MAETVGALLPAAAIGAWAASPAGAVSRSEAPAARPALATGASAYNRAQWRLDGSLLTVRLRRPLMPAGEHSIGHVRLACGDEVTVADGALPRALDDAILGAQGRARLRLARLSGRRTLRMRLTADVAAQTNWCGLRVGGAHALDLTARMTLRRGTPVRCRAAGPDSVVAENDRVLVTSASRWGRDYYHSVFRGCLKPAGLWQTLDRGILDRVGGDVWPRDFALAGTWVAWKQDASDPHWCALSRRDLASGGTQPVVPEPADRIEGTCVTTFGLNAAGTLGWIERSGPGTERLNAQRVGGTTITLDTGPAGTLANPAIAEGNTTVTWTRAGQPQTATLP